MNKRQVYSQFGIDYKDGKILFDGAYIPELLVDGNSKLGKGIWTWSTLPGNMDYTVCYNGKTICAKGTCNCNCAGCYAQTGFYNMPNIKFGNAVKTVIARNHSEFMTSAIIAQIWASNIKFVRIHASGDFFNDEYINAWKKIVAACPNCTFWTYTKNKIAENSFDEYSNINIVHSVIPNIGLNFGHCDYIMSTYNELKDAGEKVYICRCGIDKNQHCTNCKGCSENKYVLFIEHSTAYKAEKDPMYDTIKSIIDAQGKGI